MIKEFCFQLHSGLFQASQITLLLEKSKELKLWESFKENILVWCLTGKGRSVPYGRGKQAGPKGPKQPPQSLGWSQPWCFEPSLGTLGEEAEPLSCGQREISAHKQTFPCVHQGRLLHHEPRAIRRKVGVTPGMKGHWNTADMTPQLSTLHF